MAPDKRVSARAAPPTTLRRAAENEMRKNRLSVLKCVRPLIRARLVPQHRVQHIADHIEGIASDYSHHPASRPDPGARRLRGALTALDAAITEIASLGGHRVFEIARRLQFLSGCTLRAAHEQIKALRAVRHAIEHLTLARKPRSGSPAKMRRDEAMADLAALFEVETKQKFSPWDKRAGFVGSDFVAACMRWIAPTIQERDLRMGLRAARKVLDLRERYKNPVER